MSLIRNLVREPEKKVAKRKTGEGGAAAEEGAADQTDDGKPRKFVKTAIDLQRLKLDKLMKNPDKPVTIPEPRKEKDFMQTVPSFVRNVMGSSAGAGSGEFHVYRHLRRKEYARQKIIQTHSLHEQLNDEFQQKLEKNRRLAEEKTAKKRAKRLRKKQRAKKPRQSHRQDDKAEVADGSNSESSDAEQDEADADDAVAECKPASSASGEAEAEEEQQQQQQQLNDTPTRESEPAQPQGDANSEAPSPQEATAEGAAAQATAPTAEESKDPLDH